MKQMMKLAAAAATGALAAGSIVYAQTPSSGPPRAIVTLYHAAPGQQLNLLKWLAQQDEASKAAGVPGAQIYVHTDGDSWDYMGIAPVTTEAQDQAVDAAARKMNLAAGPMAGLELRKYIASHTDTYTVGPLTPAQAVAQYGAQ